MDNTFFKNTFHTPIGKLNGFFMNGKLIGLCEENPLKEERYLKYIKNSYINKKDEFLINMFKDQLNDYFEGKLFHFTIPINPQVSEFSRSVFMQLQKIEYGSTLYYKDIAEILKMKGYRAVGNSIKHNPIPIVIPCHRVIGKKNPYFFSLLEGEKTKKFLLDLESKNVNKIKSR